MTTPLPTVGTAKRISTLEAAHALDGSELVAIVQNSETRQAELEAIGGFTPAFLSTARPLLTPAHAGFCIFDLTLLRPLWWTGAGWVNADGAAA